MKHPFSIIGVFINLTFALIIGMLDGASDGDLFKTIYNTAAAYKYKQSILIQQQQHQTSIQQQQQIIIQQQQPIKQ